MIEILTGVVALIIGIVAIRKYIAYAKISKSPLEMFKGGQDILGEYEDSDCIIDEYLSISRANGMDAIERIEARDKVVEKMKVNAKVRAAAKKAINQGAKKGTVVIN